MSTDSKTLHTMNISIDLVYDDCDFYGSIEDRTETLSRLANRLIDDMQYVDRDFVRGSSWVEEGADSEHVVGVHRALLVEGFDDGTCLYTTYESREPCTRREFHRAIHKHVHPDDAKREHPPVVNVLPFTGLKDHESTEGIWARMPITTDNSNPLRRLVILDVKHKGGT